MYGCFKMCSFRVYYRILNIVPCAPQGDPVILAIVCVCVCVYICIMYTNFYNPFLSFLLAKEQSTPTSLNLFLLYK